MAGVVGAVEREVPQDGELGIDAVKPGRVGRGISEPDVISGGSCSDAAARGGGQMRAVLVAVSLTATGPSDYNPAAGV